jgi:hypothetical protein
MRLVGRGDVDDVDVRRTDQRIDIVVSIHFRDAPLIGALPCRDGGAADGGDLNTQALESFDVNGSDEAGADDSGAKVVQGDHGDCQKSFWYCGFAGSNSGCDYPE